MFKKLKGTLFSLMTNSIKTEIKMVAAEFLDKVHPKQSTFIETSKL